MRKLLALLLTLGLLLSVNAGLAEPNEYGWEVPENTIEFSVYQAQTYASQEDFEEGKKEADYIMDKFLKDQFNVVINKTQSIQEAAEWVTIAITDGNYPDMVAWLPAAQADQFAESETAIPLDDLLAEYGQNILAEVGTYIEMCRSADGKVYKMPVNYGPKIDQVGYAFSIRYDWWQELVEQGKVTAYPATPEEWYQQVKMMIENHPVNDKGEKTYAVTACDKNGQNLLNTLLGAWGFYNGFDVDENNNLTTWVKTERAKEICLFANKLWREGLIHPDFLSFDYDNAQANAVDDRLAGNISTWWYMFTWGHEYWQEVDPETPLEKRFVNLAVTADGVEHQTMASLGFLSGYYWVLTDACENPEDVIKFLNWEASPIGTLITTQGVPSEDNIYDIVGDAVVMREKSLDASVKNVEFHDVREKAGAGTYWLSTRQSAFTAGNIPFPYKLDPRIEDSLGGYDVYPKTEDKTGYLDPGWNICWGDYDTEWVWDNTTLNTYTLTSDNPVYDTNNEASASMKAMWVKIVCAESEEQALAYLEDLRAELERIGIDDVDAFRSEAYKANLELLDQDGIVFVNKK